MALFIYKTAVIIDIMVVVVGVVDWFYLQHGRGNQYFDDNMMIFRSWRGGMFAGLWRPMAACGIRLGIPQTPYQYLSS